jgi:hypothetical protein
MAALVIAPLPGAGLGACLRASVRGWFSRRLLLRLVGIETVVLEGRAWVVRPVPLGIARELVPAIVRCSQKFAAHTVDEPLIDDLIRVVALGLRAPPAQIERLRVGLWDLVPVIERIARVNGLAVVEAGGADMGKLLAALTNSTGTSSTVGSSARPAGHGITSTNS